MVTCVNYKIRLFLIVALVLSAPCVSISQNIWEPASGAPAGTVSAFTEAPNGHIFAGTEVGLFRSTDGGGSWQRVNTDPNYIDGFGVLAADSSGNIYAGENGIFRSTDDGNTWTSIDSGLGTPGYFIDVRAIAAEANGVIYAGGDNGIWRSTNSGSVWTRLDTNLVYVQALATNLDGHIFVNAQDGSSYGIYRSSDSAKSWQLVKPGDSVLQIYDIATNQKGNLYVGSSGGIYLTTNDGNAWSTVPSSQGLAGDIVFGDDSTMLWIEQGVIFYSTNYGNTFQQINYGLRLHNGGSSLFISRTGRILAGSYGDGAFSTTDLGASWHKLTGLTSVDIWTLATSPNGALFVGGQPDYGGVCYSSDNGDNWTRIDSGFANPATGAIAINRSGHIFASTIEGSYRSTDSGKTWMSIDSGLEYFFNTRLYSLNQFAINPAGWIFAGTSEGGILRSTNEGISWESMSIGMTDSDVTALGIDRYGQIYAATWPGVGDGSIFRSRDDGQSWTNVCRDLTHTAVNGDSSFITSMAITPEGKVFVGTTNAGVYRSTDSGNSWSSANSGLNNLSIISLASDSNGNIYAGLNVHQNGSVSVLPKNGSSWVAIDSGLPAYVNVLATTADGFVFGGTLAGVYRLQPSLASVQNGKSARLFELASNSPNPFTQSTTISFMLPEPSFITLTLYDATGREVAVLLNGFMDAGEHEVPFQRGNTPSGVYFYRLESGGQSATRAMVIEP